MSLFGMRNTNDPENKDRQFCATLRCNFGVSLMAKGIALAVLAFFLTPWANAQCTVCTSCHDFCIRTAGYDESPPLQDCSQGFTCGVAGPETSRSYLDSVHPGLFARVEQTALTVTEVVPASPADEAGIVVGDQILTLNGDSPTHSCSVHQWPSKDDPNFADIVLAHRGARRHIQLSLVPVRELLAKGWSSQSIHAMPVSFRQPDSDDKPWIFGLKWKRGSSSLEVTDVLRGSAAYRAGFAVGDKIIAVNGVTIQRADAQLLAPLLSADYPVHVRLAYLRGHSRRQVELSSEGISTVLHAFAKTTPQSGLTPDLTAESF